MTDSTDNARGPELPPELWIHDPKYFTDGSLVGVTATDKPDWCFKHRYTRADLAPTPQDDPRVKALVEALGAWLKLAAHCIIEEGVCCCGDDMENHSDPINCGHSPVDHGAYVAGQLIESTRAALAAFDKGGKTND